jgi:hypothetical protein
MASQLSGGELIWVHPDCLSASNPAFQKYPQAPALFVFDEEEIEAEAWSLKRIAFLYECLLEMPVEIRRGVVVAELTKALRALGLKKIVTVHSVNPRFAEQRRRLEMAIPVEVLPAVPFVDYRGTLDLKRFSRYWKRVEPIVFDK